MFKMSKNEETDSPSVIFNEANKIMETLEFSEDKIFQSKNVLHQKLTYYEQTEQHDNDANKSIAKKRAQLTVQNNRGNTADMQNTKLRDEAKRIIDSCKEAYQYINAIESDSAECENKFGNLGNKTTNDTTLYESNIDGLIRLLNVLTEKRNTKLETLESQEERLLEEKFDLDQAISDYEKKKQFLEGNNADSELQMLEKELKELQSKLDILNDNNYELNRENEVCENDDKGLEEKYHERKFLERQKRLAEHNSEISLLAQNLDKQINLDSDSEFSKLYLTLEEYETKLIKEVRDTSKFWDDLDQNPYEGFSRIEQEISKIRADIIERSEKYSEVKNIGVNCLQPRKQKDEEIFATGSIVNQLSVELQETEIALDNFKSSTDISEQNNTMSKDLKKLCKEKENLSKVAIKIENELGEIFAQLFKTEKDKGELELLSIRNHNLMEVKNFEKDCAVTESAKTNLEEKVKYVENEVKKLEETRNNLKEKATQITTKKEDIVAAMEETDTKFKFFKSKREDLQKKSDCVSAPSPIYVRANDQRFVKPKVKEDPKKKVLQQSTAAAKRNWYSDSSMEGEEVQLSDCLKKKYRKRPAAAKQNEI